ncbi:hypothetical protein MLD38_003972 [Melastoma candidum]|uniref:Uncharacterized protein n=3 Tax=Melastoma candidum TaxID=119954 RepID=A0ACB9S3Q3_9MYRT|nr:hypothetical protein MLD38_003972 [Melastoma candidum]
MIKEPRAGGISGSLKAFRFDDETLLPFSDHHHQLMNELPDGFTLGGTSADLSCVDGPSPSSDCCPFGLGLVSSGSLGRDSPSSNDNDFSDTVFRYINQMLLEEGELDDNSVVFHDPLALEAAEKSLYEAIGQKPSPSERHSSGSDADGPDVLDSCSGSSCFVDSRHKSSSYSFASVENSVDTPSQGEFSDSRYHDSQVTMPDNFVLESSSADTIASQPAYLSNTNADYKNISRGPVEGERESIMQFEKGVEEARRFLPKNYQIFLDFVDDSTLSSLDGTSSPPLASADRGKKNHKRESIESEERSNKQSAVSVDDTELSEMFDKILLCHDQGRRPDCKNGEPRREKPPKLIEQNGHADVLKVEKVRGKKPSSNRAEAVDLRALLTLCAQAVSTDDRRTVEDYIRQIRQNSSVSGNGTQRLAHYFVNALEARLSGTGTRIYAALDCKMSAVDSLKAHHLYRSACPFQKLACIFANHNILSLAEKATTLHVIDFGILYGFQWPPLIFRLAKRAGGPPRLRITGIELPERGFRPAERVQATGQMLAKYCERFGVPFEYNAIAKKWETIRIEDLKLRKNETIAVNTLFRFKHLLDQTVAVNNPRDTVLNLIRKIKPDMFMQAVVNGSFNAPFFVTRFREALFHYSSMFDAFDYNLSQEDQVRLLYEKEFFGREVGNVLACEGSERVERPETYKQWQIRVMRAGFKQLQLDPVLMRKVRFKLTEQYHEDFVIDVDGQWMLQGWKGRILFASSGWVPA